MPCIPMYLGGEECGQVSDAGEEEEMEEEREADPAEGEHPASPEEELNGQVGGNCIIACIHEYPLLCLVHVHVLVLLISMDGIL